MRDGRAKMMATQAQLCAVSAVARHSAAARVNKTASRGRTHLHWIDGPRTRAAAAVSLVTECASRAVPSPPGRGHQACCGACPTTFRRSVHERLRPTGAFRTAGRLGRFEILLAGMRLRCSSRCPSAPPPACMPAAHSVAQTPQTSFSRPLPDSFLLSPSADST